MKWSSSVSRAARLEDAIAEALDGVESALDGEIPSVVFAFATEDHGPYLASLPTEIANRYPDALIFGCTAPGVIGGGNEVEGERGVALTAAALPGVTLTPLIFGTPTEWAEAHADLASAPSDLIVLSDAFTGEAPTLIEYLDAVFPEASKVGALAGSTGPGETSLFIGDRRLRTGSIALGLFGDVEMVTGVAQGCRPIGAPMFITRHKGPAILELDGRPALRALDGMFARLSSEERTHARGRLVIGLSMAGGLEVYEQGDFLIRDIGGVDPETGAMVVAGQVTGEEILQFHVRDAETSAEDIREVASRHLYAEPRGALLFACRGRGRSFYGAPDHDSGVLNESLGPVSIGGCFANGEIGPIAGKTYLHAYTSAFGLFRPKHQEPDVE